MFLANILIGVIQQNELVIDFLTLNALIGKI
jgi:hypothetical protein